MTLLTNVALTDARVVNEDPEKICQNLDNYSEKDLVIRRNESQKVVDKLENNRKSDSNVQDKKNKTIEEELDTFLTGTKGDHDENPKLADEEQEENLEFFNWKQDENPQFHDEEQNKNVGLRDSEYNENPKFTEEDQDKNPKLPDGFYLIENIRKKRIRQGQVQYLIKWIDWPESSNTWEPIESLSECPLLISAFEERLKRKGRRKSGSSRRPRKRQDIKQQPPSSMASSEQNTVTPSEAPPSPPPHELNVSNSGGDDHHTGTIKETADEQASQTPLEDPNGGANADDEEDDEDEAEIAKETVGENAENFQEHETESIERVKKSSQKYGNGWIPPDDEEEDMEEASETIVEIVKAIGYSSPFTVGGDVSITFVARRSDGMEVTVDNVTLKQTHPQLGTKLTKIEEQEEICLKVSEEEQEKQEHDNNKKCLKQLIEGRDSLEQQFLKEENQLQMVVKVPEDSNSNGNKFKKMVSQYAKVLGHMMKIKRNGKPGYNKRHVLPLSK